MELPLPVFDWGQAKRERTAALVKSLAPAQLVTTGSQGNLGPGMGNSVVHDHESPHIDFVTFHIWPGGHDGDYWNKHFDEYVKFYADACD